MGIPSYFSNIIKNYPQIIKKIQEYNLSFDHFFLDANSIIYDCARQCHAPDNTTTLDDLHELIIHRFIQKIEEYIAIVRPKIHRHDLYRWNTTCCKVRTTTPTTIQVLCYFVISPVSYTLSRRGRKGGRLIKYTSTQLKSRQVPLS